MTNMLAIGGIGVITAFLALTLKRYNSEVALLLSVSAGVILLLAAIREGTRYFNTLSELLTDAGIRSDDFVILLKVLGICFLTEFVCDTVTEAGMPALSGNIALSGKILVLIASVPLFSELLTVVKELLVSQ